jgi:putative peptidoglycan lipid II flippase
MTAQPSSGPKLARAAGLIGLATSTSRILGLVRDQVLAYLFGAGNAVDAYYVAFRIPNLLRDLFAEGAMSAAFVPTFTRVLTRDGRPAAWRLANNVLTTLTLVTAALVGLGLIFTWPLVTAFAGDYESVPGKLDLTLQLARIMLPFLTLVAIAAAFMGMLNALNRFFVPALSPAMFNVGSIVSMVILVPVMPALGLPPIAAVAIGVLVGGAGQVAVQVPLLVREGFRLKPIIDLRDPGLRQILVLMGPGTLGLAATQINVFVNTVLATGEGTGAVSWLNYAFRLMYLPLGIVGVSIATAAVPAIARHAARDDPRAMRHEVANGLAMMFALNLPATAGLIVLARPIIAVLFERGAFTAVDTAATAAALVCYAVGLTGYSVVKIATPAFYALGESRTPVLVTVGTVLVNVALNVVLVQRIGYLGLPAGTSIAALLNALTLVVLLRRRIGGLEGARVAAAVVRASIATLAMSAVAYGLNRGLMSVLPDATLFAQITRLGLTITGSVVALAAAARMVGLREFTDVAHAAWLRVRRNRSGRATGTDVADL